MRWGSWHVRLAMLGVAAIAVAVWVVRPASHHRAASRIKLIDDFTSGQEPNLVGGKAFLSAAKGGQINAAILRNKALFHDEGVCALTYQLARGAGASWGTGLNELDISAAQTLSFRLKADRVPLPVLRVELVDGFGHHAQSRLSTLRTTTRWQRVSIPLTAFGGVDTNRLSRFILSIGTGGEPRKGVLSLDDLEFVGPPDVFFRSLQDNLLGFPTSPLVNPRPLLKLPSEQMLRAIAEDTWGYFRDVVDQHHHLPLNFIQLQPKPLIGDYASTTDISMYLMSVVSAYDFDFISHASAVERVRDTLKQLLQLPTWHHFFYNYYNTTNLQVTSQYISSIDNAWLAAALVVVRQAFPELNGLTGALLDPMDFSVFYDPQNGQIRLGYEIKDGRFAPYHYGLLATEARVISLVAIGKGDVGEEHWFRVYRTLPKEWTWQRQAPKGTYNTYLGHDVFNGYYLYPDHQHGDIPFVPSWGGSLFEFLMPTLVVDEQRLAPNGLGMNDQRAVEIHLNYALKERRYPVWGISPCATPKERHGGYSEFGVAALGSKGYKDEAIVTPHASVLALSIAPEAVEENLRTLLRRYAIYGPYGFYDSVDVQTGDVAYRYLAVDEGMILNSLNNYLNHGAIQHRFETDPIMKRAKPLLHAERFFDHDGLANSK